MGSTLALCHYLRGSGHEAMVITPNSYPDFLKWIPGQEMIINYETQLSHAQQYIDDANLIFTLDFNHLSRIGDMQKALLHTTAQYVMIDHHQQPDSYADFVYSDTSMSSTCQMVYHFMEQLEVLDKITPTIATCIYLGIMTDTGSFRFRSTTSTTHRVLSALIDAGANNTEIHEKIYDANSYSRLQLTGVALKNLKVFPEYRTAYITLSQKELFDHDFKKGDTEGLVNYGLSLEGVIFAAIFIENEKEKIIKISLRSKGKFSVNKFSRNHFEGGGHDNAAGGKSELSLSATIDKFISILPTYKEVLNAVQ